MAQLPSQSQFGDYGEWPGRDVLDSGGERLGGVREIYLDRETGRPEWVLVDVDGDESRFVPLADAAVESTTIRVAHSAAAIRNAPGIGAEPRIDQSEERRLYDHYGLGYLDAGSGLPAEAPALEHERPADETTRQHERPADETTPTAWGAPDAAGTTAPDAAAPQPTGWGTADPETRTPPDSAPETAGLTPPLPDSDADPAAAYLTDPEPAAFRAPDREPEVVPPWRDTPAPPPFTAPDPEPSSWSAAAGEDEPSNLAPPPAEPPSPQELEAAGIPEPPAVSERAPEPDPLPPAALGPDSPTGVTTPSGAGEILATGAGAPEALTPGFEPELLSAGPSEPDALSPGTPDTDPITAGAAGAAESDLTAQHGPDVVGVFSAPSPPTPPAAVEPDPVSPPPPAPDAARPRPFTVPPRPPEPPAGGALDVIKTRRGGITAGVAIVAVLFFIVRKLR
jgi:PRC-barrel domain